MTWKQGLPKDDRAVLTLGTKTDGEVSRFIHEELTKVAGELQQQIEELREKVESQRQRIEIVEEAFGGF